MIKVSQTLLHEQRNLFCFRITEKFCFSSVKNDMRLTLLKPFPFSNVCSCSCVQSCESHSSWTNATTSMMNSERCHCSFCSFSMLKTRCVEKKDTKVSTWKKIKFKNMQKSEDSMCILGIMEENADYWKAVAWLFPDRADNVRCAQ